MKANLILHIGRHKTGTTAIQHYLWTNRKILLQNHGLLYPESQVAGMQHSLIPGAHLKNHPFLPKDRITDPEILHAKLCEEASLNDPGLIVMSSETFCELACFDKQSFEEEINRFRSDFHLTIIETFRDPVDMAFSSVKHLIRIERCMHSPANTILSVLKQSQQLSEVLDEICLVRQRIPYKSRTMIEEFLASVNSLHESRLTRPLLELPIAKESSQRINSDDLSATFYAFYFLLFDSLFTKSGRLVDKDSIKALCVRASELALIADKLRPKRSEESAQQFHVLAKDYINELILNPNMDIVTSALAKTFHPLLEDALATSSSTSHI
jgi:hypothetical protein